MSRETSTCFVTLRIVGRSSTGAAWQHGDVVKLVFCLRRRGDLSREEFQRHWRETHAPLVRDRQPALAIRRYVQVHTLPAGTSAALTASRAVEDEEYDGVAELWWDSLEALAAAVGTPEGQRAGAELLEDERRFIDLARSPIFLAEEHVVVEDESGGRADR
jgi:uncharacterized protein (TIGR02118 family)